MTLSNTERYDISKRELLLATLAGQRHFGELVLFAIGEQSGAVHFVSNDRTMVFQSRVFTGIGTGDSDMTHNQRLNLTLPGGIPPFSMCELPIVRSAIVMFLGGPLEAG